MYGPTNPLEQLVGILAGEMKQVSELIQQTSKSKYSDLAAQIITYIISSGGKRIRPLLTIAAAKLLSYEGDHHILLAAAVECIHTATLLHDDVIDQSNLRRGMKTSNAVWGNQAAILVGDYLFSQAFKFMVETKVLEALAALANASSIISEAEILQLQLINKIDLSEELYFELISAKTAELFATSCLVGGIAAQGSIEQLNALYEYGKIFGIVFQIIDDLLDYYDEHKKTGKNIGGDFCEGKVTLPLIFLYKCATPNEKLSISAIFQAEHQRTHEDLAVILDLCAQYKIKALVIERASILATQGVNATQSLPDSPILHLMRQSLESSITRIC